jgi:protein Tob/BTG
VENKVKVAMQLETESAANFLIHLMQIKKEQLLWSSGLGEAFSPKNLEKLQKAIVKRLQWRYRHFWFPDKPYKGSGYRCVRISNGKLDPILIFACNDCGLLYDHVADLLPPNLDMWIDPQETSYRIGDNGSICTLYEYPQSQPWMPKPKQAAAPPPSPPSEIRRTMMSQLCCCWL